MRKSFIEAPVVAAIVLAGLTLPTGITPAQEAQQSGEVHPATQIPTTADLNRRIGQLSAAIPTASLAASAAEYRIGADDVLEVNVFGAPELNQKLRVSAAGDISMPLAGPVEAAGLTARELEKAYALDADWILLDFRRLAFMDSTGLHLLVKAQQRAEEAGRRLALTRGGEQVQRLLDLTGVADLVRIVESPEQLLETDRAPDGP